MSQSPLPLLPALVVPGTTLVGICADQMKLNGTSAILIREAGSSEISGIFTDRDLFLKMNSDIPLSELVQRQVRSVMTSPVVCLDSERLHLAPRLMVEKNIRHIPLVRTDANGKKTVLGILTQDHVFKQALAHAPKALAAVAPFDASQPPVAIGVLSEDMAMVYRMNQSVVDLPHVWVRHVRRAELMTAVGIQSLCETVKGLIVDVDDFGDARRLARLLIELRERPELKKIMLLEGSRPAEGVSEIRSLLSRLTGANPFLVAPKPLGLSHLIQLLPAA